MLQANKTLTFLSTPARKTRTVYLCNPHPDHRKASKKSREDAADYTDDLDKGLWGKLARNAEEMRRGAVNMRKGKFKIEMFLKS